MFKSFSDSIRCLWHSNTNETVQTPDRKRKRPLVETYEDDSDIEIVSVKKPRQESGTGLFSFLKTPMSKMSEWVRKKRTGQQDYFIVRPVPNNSDWNIDKDADRGRHIHGEQRRLINVTVRSTFNSTNGTFSHVEGHDSDCLSRPSILGKNGSVENGVNGDVYGTHSIPVSSASSRQSSCSSRLGLGRLTTVDRCFRLKERDQYLKLLQQQTTVDLGYHANKLKNDQQKKDFVQSRPACASSQPSSLFSDYPAALSASTLSSGFSGVTNERPDSRWRVTPNRFAKTPTLSADRHGDGPSIFRTSTLADHFAVPRPMGRHQQHHRPGTSHRPPLLDSKNAATLRPPAEDECVVVLDDEEEETARRMVSATRPAFTSSEYLDEEWINKMKSKHEITEKERQAAIKEAELTKKLYEERREGRLCNLDKRLRQQMKLFDNEPEVIEDIPIPEVPQEKPLPELTDSMQREISAALESGHPGDVLSEAFRLKITRGDIATLRGLNWLNDEIINFYMNMLMARGEQDGFEKTYCFNTFFFPKLISGGHSAVRRWTRTVDIFAHSYLVIPVHLGVHWCVCIVFIKDKKIVYYDSMGGSNNQCLNAVRQYLSDESAQKRNIKLDMSNWTAETAKDIPLQMNGSDCGMFSCMYAETLTRGAQINFTQKDMPYFRRRMVYEILKKKLL